MQLVTNPRPQKTILVVEDDASIRESMHDLLEEEGYAVAEAEHGLSALEYLKTHDSPGAILLDLSMPVMDGHTFLQRKNENPEWGRIPTIVVSAVADPIAQPGVIAALRKPVDIDMLTGLLNNHIATDTSSMHGFSPEQEAGALKAFISSVQGYAIFLLDPHGYVRTWSRGAEQIKGYTAAEVTGKHFSLFYPPKDVEAGKPRRALELAGMEGRYAEEGWRIRKDGSRFWANVVITAIYGKHGEITGFGKLVSDLTAKHEADLALRRSEARYRSLVAGVKDYAIFALDQRGRISSWNAGAEHMKGYKANEIIGSSFSVFYTAEDLAAHKPEHELEEARLHGKYEETGWRIRKDGSRFLSRILITPTFDDDGNLSGYTKITRDITNEQEAARIAESLRMRDLFLSVVAHELRTPISSVLLQAGAVKRQIENSDRGEKLNKRLLKYFSVSKNQIERLSKLVNDLMDLSRINSSSLQLQKAQFDLNGMIAATIEAFELIAEQSSNQIQFHATQPIVGTWDKLRLEQVITNLLSNALRHAPGTTISITASVRGDCAVVEISDEGPGIPENEIQEVMRPFVQSGNTPKKSVGLGIGLFIAQRIIAEHDGALELSNRVPSGLTATVRLPMGAPRS